MLPAERRNYIMDILRKEGKVEIDSLAVKLGVSPMTVRRDLAILEEQGVAYRTHGGAVLHNGLVGEVPYTHKETSHIEEKRRIGQEAATLIKDGQVIILDSGTTTREIVRGIKNLNDLTVITNDLKIALELSETTDFKVFCTGGLVQNRLGAMLGSTGENFLAGIRVDITFLGASAIDLKWGMTSPNLDKASMKKKMMAAADRVVLVADHTKFGKKSFAQIAPVEEVDLLITDRGLDQSVLKQIIKLGVQTRVV
ncbi:DeoR/GlpR family DNA-binding transcription regulator [Desulfotomaculum nigrificans]|uniref:DeoR/GlpR family DNA-binding transcription regulator n=1 Tax=Desulfotomaculum nigrificans TaxID=1565 RepID=UPI0001FADFF9|nr:DeoR/GlpR family DNA-binding transcription regulator [Desulfotomaculum nigrificans]